MNILIVSLLTLFGLYLRLIGIDKPQGLWNDEYISWFVASHSFNNGFLREILAQCHMPLYYLYLKCCMFFGGSSDLFLRVTSVVPGVLAIIVMYFVGLQNNKKTGVICALFTAVSSFLIYYSQEVRLYSLLFLLSAFALLYFLRFMKNKTWTNLGGLVLFNFLIIFTHTIGFVFVFFQLVGLSVLLFKEYKKQLLSIWFGVILLGSICIPQVVKILTTPSFSQWWGHFTLSKIGFLFTDYFSPVLTNLVNAPDKLLYIKSVSFVFFTFVPAILAILFICRAVYNNKENAVLLGIFAGVILVLTGAAVLGKLVFITKYSIEIYPILLYLAAFGVCAFEHKKIAYTLVSILLMINLLYLFISPASAPKIPRPQGHKIVADLLNRANPKDGDFILLEYYPQNRFEKYFDFSKYTVHAIDKGSFPIFMAPDVDYAEVLADGKAKYRDVFAEKVPAHIDAVLIELILKQIKPGQNVFVVMSDSVAIYSPVDVQQIASDDYLYNKTPIMYMIFSYIKNKVFIDLSKSLAVTRYEKMGDWSIVRFTKLNK